MTKLIIKTGTEEDFFARGRRLAKAADRGKALEAVRTISFEDPADVMKLITETRLALFRAVKEAPGSITDIAARLQRDGRQPDRNLHRRGRFRRRLRKGRQRPQISGDPPPVG